MGFTRAELLEYRRFYLQRVASSRRLEPAFDDEDDRDAWRIEHRRWADAYQERFGTSLEFEAASIVGLQ